VLGLRRFEIPQDDRRPKAGSSLNAPSVVVWNSYFSVKHPKKNISLFYIACTLPWSEIISVYPTAIAGQLASSHEFQSEFHEFEPRGIMD